jgi:hypothetical protein
MSMPPDTDRVLATRAAAIIRGDRNLVAECDHYLRSRGVNPTPDEPPAI